MARANNRGSTMTQVTQEPSAYPRIPVLGSEGQQKMLIRHEENPTATVKFSGLRSRGHNLIQGFTSLSQHWLRMGKDQAYRFAALINSGRRSGHHTLQLLESNLHLMSDLKLYWGKDGSGHVRIYKS